MHHHYFISHLLAVVQSFRRYDVMTFFDCTADLVGQLNGNGQKGMLQIDAPPVENFWLRHCMSVTTNKVKKLSESETTQTAMTRHINHE